MEERKVASLNYKAPTFADLKKSDRPKGKVKGKSCMVGDKVRCDCGQIVHQWVLVDVRSIPGISQDWACDGCRSHMQRHKHQISDQAPTSRKEWLTHFLGALGAPEEAIEASRHISKEPST